VLCFGTTPRSLYPSYRTGLLPTGTKTSGKNVRLPFPDFPATWPAGPFRALSVFALYSSRPFFASLSARTPESTFPANRGYLSRNQLTQPEKVKEYEKDNKKNIRRFFSRRVVFFLIDAGPPKPRAENPPRSRPKAATEPQNSLLTSSAALQVDGNVGPVVRLRVPRRRWFREDLLPLRGPRLHASANEPSSIPPRPFKSPPVNQSLFTP